MRRCWWKLLLPPSHFNSRTSCEVRRALNIAGGIGIWISTHAPLARCDIIDNRHTSNDFKFQLTHLLRGATRMGDYLRTHMGNFNSRTSCEVRLPRHGYCNFVLNFNSRTSCEVRRVCVPVQPVLSLFQLTHLLRGATRLLCYTRHIKSRFQLTHLLRGATTTSMSDIIDAWKFQLTHLLRGATLAECGYALADGISTHAPLARCDIVAVPRLRITFDFNSRTSCEVRRAADEGGYLK